MYEAKASVSFFRFAANVPAESLNPKSSFLAGPSIINFEPGRNDLPSVFTSFTSKGSTTLLESLSLADKKSPIVPGLVAIDGISMPRLL